MTGLRVYVVAPATAVAVLLAAFSVFHVRPLVVVLAGVSVALIATVLVGVVSRARVALRGLRVEIDRPHDVR